MTGPAPATRTAFATSLRKLWRLFDRRDRMRLATLTVLLVIAAALEVIGVGLVPVVVGAIADPEQLRRYAVVGDIAGRLGLDDRTDLLLAVVAALVALFALKTAYRYFTSWMQARLLGELRLRLSTELFGAYMRAPYAFHLGRNPADLMRNANQEVEHLILFVVAPIVATVGTTLVGLAIACFIVVVEPLVTLACLALFGAATYVYLRSVRERAAALGRQAQEHRAGVIKAVNQGLGGLKEARILGREDSFVTAYDRSVKRLTEAFRHQFITSDMIGPSLELVAVVGLAAIVALLLASGTGSTDIVPILALYAAALLRLKQAVWQFASVINTLRYQIVVIDPVYDDLRELGAATAEAETTREVLPFREAIEISDLSFRYAGAEGPALTGISVTIPRGASVGLVGATGSGKSTLADLILGLLEPQGGTIAVDGRDIRGSRRAWQANVGYIPQSLYLLDDTLRRNIAFGLPDERIDDERVRRAMHAAQLDDVVESFPLGLDTMLGDRGVRLSGGQRQRVCIARALYDDPAVLMLDEATSALDNRTEQRIVSQLDARRGERTLIVIAHRLSTVRHCDFLLLLRKGRLEAVGTFDELLAGNEHFRTLAQHEPDGDPSP